MKILHIITDLKNGGSEKILSNLILSDNKNIHTLITLKKKHQIGLDLEKKNINVIEVDFNNNTIIKSLELEHI